MGLTNKKEEQLKNMPLIESKITRSKDGKFMIHKTTITTIKPTEYYKVVMNAPVEETVTDSEGSAEAVEA
jgi:hypothetical protein